jgi:hypothetical protein
MPVQELAAHCSASAGFSARALPLHRTLVVERTKGVFAFQGKGVFSCPDSVAAESLFRTVVHCSILFFSVKNYPKLIN